MATKRPLDGDVGSLSQGYASTSSAPSRQAASIRGVQQEQKILHLRKEGPLNPDTKDYCAAFAALDLDNSWDLALFKKSFSIEIKSMSDELVEFDMIGIDPPLANAFRRILISEIPTVAISSVTIFQNTGVIHDENLAHRLGLVPITCEPELLEWKPPDHDFNEDNSIVFTLQVACELKQGARKSVYSGDLVWEPLSPAQRERFKDVPPKPTHNDILIAKLRGGQEIELQCRCELGIGRSHAKWSPVCTATYRLLPYLDLSKEIQNDDAEMSVAETCPTGVFDIEGKSSGKKAVVAQPRKCTTCRECINSFAGENHGLVLGKLKDHYLFSIESAGQIPATKLFERAIQKLKQKCKTAKGVIQHRQASQP